MARASYRESPTVLKTTTLGDRKWAGPAGQRVERKKGRRSPLIRTHSPRTAFLPTAVLWALIMGWGTGPLLSGGADWQLGKWASMGRGQLLRLHAPKPPTPVPNPSSGRDKLSRRRTLRDGTSIWRTGV